MRHLAYALLAATALTQPGLADPNISFDRFDFRADHRAGPIAAGIWSPAGSQTYIGEVGGNPIFLAIETYIGAAIPDEPHPLVIFSHGSGSSIDGSAWLGAAMAERGALMVVLNHPGTTSGDSSPRRTVLLSERAADLSAVLDHLLADPYFAARIDPDRISAVGFSLGGAAVLGLAGQELDPDAYAAYCAEFGDDAQDCRFLNRGGVDFDTLPPEFSANMADDRFSRIVAVDPGFTYAATPDSQAAIDIPVQVISLGADFPWVAVDVRSTGSGLVERIADVTHDVIPNADHFSFLPLCTEIAPVLLMEEGEDPICTNPEGSDRAVVHAASTEAIAYFLGLAR